MSQKILTCALCLALLTPAGYAGKRDDKPVTQSAATKQAPAPELLTPEEEASLAKQNEQPGPEVAGGALSNEHLTYIVIALAAAVLVLVLK